MFHFKPCDKLAGVAAAAALMATANTALASDWKFALSPLFLWGVSVDGDADMAGKTAPLDLGFKDDVWENLEFVFTFHAEARKDDWSLFLEYQNLDLGPDVDLSAGPVTAEAEIDFSNKQAELGAGWAFYETKSTRWELIGGARYFDQELEVEVTVNLPPPIPAQALGIEGGDDWWQGFGGVRVFQSLGERWALAARADYGYGGSDNDAINLSAIIDYRFRDWGSAFVGYRYMDVDYDNDKRGLDQYAYDATQQGPLLGFTLYW